MSRFDTKLQFIRKRDGRLSRFDSEKIEQAISKAMKSVKAYYPQEATKVAHQVVTVLEVIYKDGRIPTVENVQDLVEKVLIERGAAEVAKAYILYREQRAKLRHTRALFSEALNIVDHYLSKEDWRVRENSNMSYSLQGLNNHITSLVTAQYWLERIYPQEVREVHNRGDFHIHDLGLLSAYCCGWDLQDLLRRGLGGVVGKTESLPPKHLRAALGQVVNFFYTLQGEAAGAQAFSNFDTLLAPFIRYDRLDYRELKQEMQEFLFNVNIPTRTGFQTPFTNITMDLEPPGSLRDEPVIIGGEPQKETYGEFQEEMDLFNSVFCEVMMEGDAKGRVFTFPIPTYNITKDFHWDNPHWDILWRMTAKYGTPYFSNFINSDMNPDDARSMCCRLRLDNRELRRRGDLLSMKVFPSPQKRERATYRGGGLFGANPLTGSIGVVTINLPRLGYLSSTAEEFFDRLQSLMEIAKVSLETKRKVLERFTEESLYPYSRVYLESIKESFGSWWANHFSTIGIVGMNEAAINLLRENIATQKGRDFAIQTLKFMREQLSCFSQETGNLYNLEATPAEGTSYRLARIDREQYADIFTQGDEEPYYTNSSQLPVGYTDDLFEALSLQDPLQTLYSGGTVFHSYVGEKIDDPQICKALVRKIAENFKLPYYTITPTFSICPIHGYIPGEHQFCPYEHSPEELERYGIEVLEDIGA